MDRDEHEVENDSQPSLTPLPSQWAMVYALIPLNFFFMLIADDAEGLFGPANSRTMFSVVVIAVQISVIALCALLRKKPWIVRLLVVAHYLLAGLWLTVLLEDWLVGATAMSLNVVMARRFDLPGRRLPGPFALPSGTEKTRPAQDVYVVLSVAGVALAILVVGYRLAEMVWAVLTVLALLAPAVAISLVAQARQRLEEGWRGPYLEWLILLGIPWMIHDLFGLAALLAVRQGIVVARLWMASRFMQELVRSLYRRPAALLLFGFGGCILLGAVVLGFPVCSAPTRSLDPIDALFTATSAVCVTGLIVVDTPTHFSVFGQSMILSLIQVGGLGFMTISTFAAIALGARPGFGQEEALSQIVESSSPRAAYRLVRFIVLVTLVIEGIGAALLAGAAVSGGMPMRRALWFGVFHSISAFCNAGFALQTDSLMPFATRPFIVVIVAFLIIAGGLGFAVLASLWDRLRGAVARDRRRGTMGRDRLRDAGGRANAHVKMALAGTGLLLALSTPLFLVIEWSGAFGSYPWWSRLVQSFFLAVTARTAGFNSCDLTLLGPASVLILVVLMFIGACPGSTGGGVKVTTVGVLLMSIRATLLGRGDVEVFGRRLALSTVTRATAIITISMGILGLALLLLLLTQGLSPEALVFEAVSAFGTVGLSLGVTSNLNVVGKLVIIALMFVGRVGPLTLVLVLGQYVPQHHRYPQEEIPVG